MTQATLLFPHQLFKNIDFINQSFPIYLIEETLFFNQYNFHKQKLFFHRASMKFYASYLKNLGYQVNYIEAKNKLSDTRLLIDKLIQEGITQLTIIDPSDNWLEKRIKLACSSIELNYIDNPLFLNTKKDLSSFFKASKKKFFQTSFYKSERKKRNILMIDGKPEGGKWTYDDLNRKKYPKGKTAPKINFPAINAFYEEAKRYIEDNFSDNIGELNRTIYYPISFKSADKWFEDFLKQRFEAFGDFEDAIVNEEHFLNHSLLSPLLNVGLLPIQEVLEKTQAFASKNNIPINSLEGFIRQLIGWREFIRGVYVVKGSEERTHNFWKHTRKIPESFYTGETGILPIDTTIKKILKTGYCHHIERLMILANFMNLCEFAPDEVYQWFMEMFIDAYDWVMVPNVYGMSLFADGGLMSTKPYISSSNYIKKMSDYPKGKWQETWDGLFWNFMHKHQSFFESNPRLSLLLKTLNTMDSKQKEKHLANAKKYLENLS